MITVEILTPVLPDKALENEIVEKIKRLSKDNDAVVKFKDARRTIEPSSFEITVTDNNGNKLPMLQNKLLVPIVRLLLN